MPRREYKLKNNYSTEDYKEKGFDPVTGKQNKTSFFFLDGVLHKRVRVNRSLNIVYCVKYPECDTVAYPWDHVKKTQKRALRIVRSGKDHQQASAKGLSGLHG